MMCLVRKHWLIALTVVAVLLFVGAWEASFIPHYVNECTYSYETYVKECAPKNVFLFLLRETKELIEHNDKVIGALSGAAVAAFTGTLWWSTRGLFRATNASIQLARDEFIATHRPKIIVYGMEVSLPGDDKPRPVHFRFVNTGDTDASVTLIESKIVYAKGMAVPAGINLVRHDVIKQPILVRSGWNGIAITPEGAGFINLVRSGKEGVVFCVGVIVYRDKNDIERRTGFCRWYDSESGRWKKLYDEDYEYVY